MINDVKATQDQYNYTEGTHTLTVNLEDVLPSSSSVFKFQVETKG